METRRADFMGTWYPGTARQCEKAIQGFVGSGPPSLSRGVKGVGGIVPHAGWSFSGEIAARVFAALAKGKAPDVVAVFGMHLGPRHPNFIMARGAWETPFGDIQIAEDVAGVLAQGFPFELETPETHVQDNTIELQLPFIKYFFPDARLVPVGPAPRNTAPAMGRALVDVAANLGLSIKVIGSTDLTHYGPNYGFSPKGSGPEALEWVTGENDASVIERMAALDPEGVMEEGLSRHNACCAGAVAAAIAAGKHLGAAKAQVLNYATSHDKSPGPSFVGYAGLVF